MPWTHHPGFAAVVGTTAIRLLLRGLTCETADIAELFDHHAVVAIANGRQISATAHAANMSRDHCMGSALTPCTSQRHKACGAGEGIRFVSLSYAFATARPSHSSNVVVGGWVASSPGVHWGAGHEARRDGALEPRDPGWNRLEIHKEAACARGSDLAPKPRRAAGRAMHRLVKRAARESGEAEGRGWGR